MREVRWEEAAVETAVRRLHIVPSSLDLLGVELEIASTQDRNYRLRRAVWMLPMEPSTSISPAMPALIARLADMRINSALRFCC